jgi:DNA repair protein RecO (recombination protein O)
MKRVSLQPAYVLHRRPYRESSLLLELFTPEFGRFTAIAKGARKAKSMWAGLLQPFVPVLVSWMGKDELMTLVQAEANGPAQHLQGECLFAGLYLNELLMYLLQKWDAHAGLYAAYERAIIALQVKVLEQKILRSFEKYLLEELGYGLLPKADASLHNMFVADKFYRFTPEQGFVLYNAMTTDPSAANVFSGKTLIAIAKEDWQDETCLRDAKRLNRFVLAPLLGTKTIYSRQLFVQRENKDEE